MAGLDGYLVVLYGDCPLVTSATLRRLIETETSSHYFYDHEDNAEAAAMARRVFVEEDEPMIEAAQRALGDQDFWDARPAILKTDAGAIRARRALMQLRKAEETAAA